MQDKTIDKPIFIALSLGANLGNKAQSLEHALQLLDQKIDMLQCSSIYETEPVGYSNQPVFYNCACIGQTNASIDEIHLLIKAIEKELGRQVRPQWHEREIDIDILLYGDYSIQEELITVPHPRMQDRAFVMTPLLELAPLAKHPVLQQTVEQLHQICPDTATIIKVLPPIIVRG